MKLLKTHRCFDGQVRFWEHESVETRTSMKFSTFTPPGEIKGCLIWLSGLSCTDENFISKAGAQRHLAEHGLMLICPDTSPRGLSLPGEHDHWDFGASAGFYVDATTPGYRDHYRMYSYVNSEVHMLVQNEFNVAADRISLFGHSMGGHGALVLGLREPSKYCSLSAFAPIANPVEVPWGQKAFRGYLGASPADWKTYDSCELIRAGARHPHPILVDQGSADDFLEKQLKPDRLIEACLGVQPIELRRHEGYDHGYYFIASFIADHILFHAKALSATSTS